MKTKALKAAIIIVVIYLLVIAIMGYQGHKEQAEYNDRHNNGDTLTEKEYDSIIKKVKVIDTVNNPVDK